MSLRRRTLFLAGALALAAFAVPAARAADQATRIEGVSFEARAQLAGSSLQLNGVGVRAVAWFKGYAAGLYLGQRAQTPEQVLAMAGPKRLQMRMLVDVPVGEFVKAFHKGIERNTPETRHVGLADRMSDFDRLLQPLGKVRKGDSVNLDFVPGTGMVFTLNGRTVGAPIVGDDFYDALLGIFIGPKPVDDKLKAGLLGGAAP